MILPAILRSLQKLLELFESKNVSYMVIGGYALPFYGRIRTTIDLDLAVVIKGQEGFDRLRSWLASNDFEVTVGSPQNPLIVVLDRKEKVEMELWLKPDGVVFDAELLRRRRKARLDAKVEAWVISPEDFIVNKLARPDRGVIDEQDVKSVLVRQEGKLDEEYLKRRAREAGVLTLLENIDAC
jgi:hypothetical protein